MPLTYFARVESIATALVAFVAVVIELRTGEIPNWLTLSTLMVGPIIGIFDHRLVDHWVALAIAVVPTMLAYRADWLGGGGLKLIVAASALIGLRGAILIVGLATVVGLAVFAYERVTKTQTFVTVPTSPIVLVAVLGSIALGVRGLSVGTSW